MESLTLAIAAVGVAVVAVGRPVYGLIAYLSILLLYPDYLRVSLGTVDISACRIVVCALVVRCLAETQLTSRFQWKLLDKLVFVSALVNAATLAMTTPFEPWLENRFGFVMDTLVVYVAVRLVVVDRQAFETILKALGVLVVAMAAHAVFEMFTGKSLYMGLGQYCPWAPNKGMEFQTRFGLNRAMGPSGETIMFGLTFACLAPLLWILRHTPGWRGRGFLFAAAACVGVAATVSSGPYMALLVVAGCLALERMKSLVRPAIVIAIVGCLAIELGSNRHFYYVLGDFTMDPESAWYRARLIDVAISKIPEYWKYGYGFGDPGWGPLIDGRSRSDGVNDYVVQAVLHGIFGLAVYLGVLAAALHGVVRKYRETRSQWTRSAVWALACAMIGMMTAFWSVSLFGQTISVFYVLLGMHGALAAATRTVTAARPAWVPTTNSYAARSVSAPA